MTSTCTHFLTFWFVFLTIWIARFALFLGVGSPSLPSSRCRLIPSEPSTFPPSSEDLARGKSFYLFVTQGDLHTCFHESSSRAVPGNIWYFDLLEENSLLRPLLASFDFLPPGSSFQPHGFYLSNRTDTMYVINHAGNYSSVEIFRVEYDVEGRRPSLRHARTIASELFRPYSINDVVEGATSDEIYVTQWLPYGYPIGGKNHPTSVVERLKNVGTFLFQVLSIRATRVYRCSTRTNAGGGDPCRIATHHRFIGANGITVDDDRTTVFVSDPAGKEVVVFRRRPEDGWLSRIDRIDLPFAPDNVEYDDGDLVMGSIPILHTVVYNDGVPAEAQKPVAGGMMVATRRNNRWVVSNPVMHDGKTLSQISAASRIGDRVFLGSPYSSGVLECRMREERD